MTARTFATKTDVLERIINPTLTVDDFSTPEDFDVDEIFQECFTYHEGTGFVQTASDDEYWSSVERHAFR